MGREQAAFQIERTDMVATALTTLGPGVVILRGDSGAGSVLAVEEIPAGHKIALRDIARGEGILKYNVPVGRATRDIPAGTWVHLHCMESIYDARSGHLDVITGVPGDIAYE